MSIKPRVLILEDSLPSAKLVASLVELAGGTPEIYEGGGEALSALPKGNVPALIIVDLNLPDGDGCRWARKMRKASDVTLTIWACSARSAEEMMETAWNDMPFDGWIGKPFDARELLARLGDILSVAA
jgi:chemosensory pili system protein ChpA (sensor histidine kinase/response regulator)